MQPTDAGFKMHKRSMWHPNLTPSTTGLGVCFAAALAASPVAAQPFTFHVEPAAAFWVDKPQSNRFTTGGYVAFRPGIGVGRFVSLQASYALLAAPAGDGFDADGSAHFLLAGARVRPLVNLRPASEQLGGLFVDANLGYVRTGDLDRFGFDGGLGYGFQLAPWFSIGPVARYGQVVQRADIPNQGARDAQFITLGLDLGFGPPHSEEHPRWETAEVRCPAATECVRERVNVPTPCTDSDSDGTCDTDDRCPSQNGPPATLGCPIDPCGGAPLVVLVQFPFDSASMPPPQNGAQKMDPVLDAVAQAIGQDPTCRVCIIGHASEEGSAEYNQELSSRRASEVQGYMTARGVAETRIPTTGLGERCQLVPETTHILNRRVEFRRLQEEQSCPTECWVPPAK